MRAATTAAPARGATMLDYPVRKIMRRQKLLTAKPEAFVAKAAQRMAARNVGAVLVVEGERLVGIFTERDLLFASSPGLERAPRARGGHDNAPVTITADSPSDMRWSHASQGLQPLRGRSASPSLTRRGARWIPTEDSPPRPAGAAFDDRWRQAEETAGPRAPRLMESSHSAAWGHSGRVNNPPLRRCAGCVARAAPGRSCTTAGRRSAEHPWLDELHAFRAVESR